MECVRSSLPPAGCKTCFAETEQDHAIKAHEFEQQQAIEEARLRQEKAVRSLEIEQKLKN